MKKPKKSQRHKEENTFRFKSFHERISDISVDLRQHLIAAPARLDPEESFFFDAYNKWLDLNRTQYFSDFQKDVRGKVSNHKMVVRSQKIVVDALLKHLQVESSLALEPLLELTTNLARDLDADFYQYYPEFFRIFCDRFILSSDTEVLEWAFSCLSQLYKILWKYMTKDLQNIFRLMVPLLEDGQKEYITRFATESFAFLIRSHRDTAAVVEFLFSYCDVKPELSVGIGILLFEAVKNVNQQLHKVLDKILPVILDKGGDGNRQTASIETCIQSFVEHLLGHMSRETCRAFWDIFLPKLSERKYDSCHMYLLILNCCCEAKRGALIVSPSKVLQALLEAYGDANTFVPERDSELLVSIARNFLQLSSINLDAHDRQKLSRAVFGGKCTADTKFAFAQSLVELPLYEIEVLPHLLQLCLREFGSERLQTVVNTLAHAALHKDPRQFETENLLSWKPFPFDFGIFSRSDDSPTVTDQLKDFVNLISSTARDLDVTDELRWCYLWALSVLLPHIRPKLSSVGVPLISSTICKCVEFLEKPSKEPKDRCSRVVLQTLFASLTALFVADPAKLKTILDVDNMSALLRKFGTDVRMLLALNVFLQFPGLHPSVDQLQTFTPLLRLNLRHPSHPVRLASLRALFNLAGLSGRQVLQSCLDAEKVEVSIHEYREKLRFLRKLDANQLPEETTELDLEVPLLYLLGSLKIGFQLIWKEVKTIISSYASRLSRKELWSVMARELLQVSEEAESLKHDIRGELPEDEGTALIGLLDEHYRKLATEDSKPLDAHKYRIQLWQCLAGIADHVEARNRVFSELLQRFIRNEFAPATLFAMPDNLTGNSEPFTGTLPERSSRRARVNAEETLCVMLELFVKFYNPLALFQEPVLRGMMFELLAYRSPKVQGLVLQFLFRYKWEYVQPYEQHLMSLMEEKEMWNTLVEIEFGAANPVIEPQHRKMVVPILIRILFGRMQAKAKRRTTEKGAPRGRKEGIVRSLANCLPDEFEFFLDLVLQPYRKLLRDGISDGAEATKGTETISAYERIADGILQTLFVVIDELRGVVASSIHRILRAVLGIQTLALVPDQSSADESDSTMGPGLRKKLRKECCRCLAVIGSVFPADTFSSEEHETVFNIVVWPELYNSFCTTETTSYELQDEFNNISRDGPSSVTPLMRLLSAWSQSQTYQRLLALPNPVNANQTPLSALVDLLDPVRRSKPHTEKLVVNVLNSLFYPKTDDPEEKPIDQDILQRSIAMVLPHIDIVLAFLRGKLLRGKPVAVKSKKASRKVTSPLDDEELRLACGISDLSLSSQQSQMLLDVLLPFLTNSELKKEETLVMLLGIVAKLVAQVDQSKLAGLIRPVVRLFSRNFTREARDTLCAILKAVADRSSGPRISQLYSTANKLLSWNPRHIDEPDYDVRVATYKATKQTILELGDSEDDMDYALTVIHISAYDIQKIADIAAGALRTMGGLCVMEIIKHFAKSHATSLVILEQIMPLLKNGLKNPQEAVRNEYIAILGTIAANFPEHPVFRSMQILLSPEDAETDVFENLRHIQKHRVGRALHRLATLCEEGKLPVAIMLQYFFPLALVHLCNDQYAGEKLQGLINAVIGLIEAVCRKVPWAKYEPLLKHFLNMMARKPVHQKQMIRVVVAVVDAFHFDLSAVDLRHNVKGTTTTTVDELDDFETAAPEASVARQSDKETGDGTSGIQTSKAKAEKIYRSLTQFILPNLSRLMTDKGPGEDRHKLTADISANEKTELLRPPVALAIVKLLQKLPEQILRRQIRGVFLKIAALLKSRLLSVRQLTRETLTTIMNSLGPSFLPVLIKELKGVLRRGYQVHVLVHCIHMMLTKMLPVLKSGDLDRCIEDLVQICHNEMFGELAEEKEVSAVTRKIAEAKSVKSYDTYAILARFASPGVLIKLIKPLKEKAEETQSHKVAVKLDKALRQILSGLITNTQLTEVDLLKFAYALYDTNVGMFADTKRKVSVRPVTHLDRPDIMLIAPEPTRAGPVAAASKSTNDYLLQDFSLQILVSCFKNGRFNSDSEEHLQMLDPFVAVVRRCLNSKQVTVMTNALRCYIWMLKFKLPSLETSLEPIIKSLFVHLKNYSGPGAGIGENADFVNALYKALSASVRDAVNHKLSDKHLKVLLTYAENDFQEGSKQVLAANLLRAVLSRHLLTPQLREMMLNLAKASIQSEQENVRQQCRQVGLEPFRLQSVIFVVTASSLQLVYLFVTTYNAKKIKAKEFVELFRDNMEYPVEQGRLVALAMLNDIFDKMGEGFMKDHALAFFQLFAARLSDESSVCRQKAAEAISRVMQQVEPEILGDIYKWCLRWIRDKEVSIKRIGLQTCTMLVQTEKAAFAMRLTEILGEIQKLAKPQEDLISDFAIREYDHMLINMLSLVLALQSELKVEIWKTGTAESKAMSSVLESICDLFIHEHEWVRVRSLEVFIGVFQQQPPENLESHPAFRDKFDQKMKKLTSMLIQQGRSYSQREDYYSAWSECLIYVMLAVAAAYPSFDENVEEVKKEEDEDGFTLPSTNVRPSLPFLVKSVCREAVYEAVNEPRKTTKRAQVLKLICQLCSTFSSAVFQSFLPSVLQVVFRCANEPSAQKDENLKQVTEETSRLVETHVGREAYAVCMQSVMSKSSSRRAERKRQQAIEPVLNPEKSARKKIKKQQSKKLAHKRKVHDIELGIIAKRKKTKL